MNDKLKVKHGDEEMLRELGVYELTIMPQSAVAIEFRSWLSNVVSEERLQLVDDLMEQGKGTIVSAQNNKDFEKWIFDNVLYNERNFKQLDIIDQFEGTKYDEHDGQMFQKKVDELPS